MTKTASWNKQINGVPCTVTADEYGQWRIESQDRAWAVSDVQLDVATVKARTQINRGKAKISVPFRTLSGDRGVVTGLHGGTGRAMVTLTDTYGRQQSVQYDLNSRVLRDDTSDEVIAEIHSKQVESGRLKKEADLLIDVHRLPLKRTVEQAITDAQPT